MFKVKFWKRIFDDDAPMGTAPRAKLSKEVELPFAPCVGQSFFWPSDVIFGKTVSATWNFKTSSFSCYLDDAFRRHIAAFGGDFLDLVHFYESAGWEVDELETEPGYRSG